jgi:hypothetical protein
VKTFILGDIHGAYKNCLEILKSINVVDERGRWRKGLKATLIQVGDVIDRGDDPLKSFRLLRELQEEAQNEGGMVIRLLGNHELSCIGGPKAPGGIEGYLLTDIIKKDIIDGKIIAAHILDDWTVVHAGITPKISAGKNINELAEYLNSKLVDAVKNDDFSDEIFFVGRSRGGYKEPGIFWADYDLDLLPFEDKLIKQIVGHTPSFGVKPKFKVSPGGKIIDVDIGMCNLYGGNKGILVYKNNKFNFKML